MKCFVPGCFTGYQKTITKNKKLGLRNKSLFTAKSEAQRQKWIKAIPRNDRVFSNRDSVCELHFSANDILRFFETPMPDGTVYKLERERPFLKNDACPIFFPTLTRSKAKRCKRGRKGRNSGSPSHRGRHPSADNEDSRECNEMLDGAENLALLGEVAGNEAPCTVVKGVDRDVVFSLSTIMDNIKSIKLPSPNWTRAVIGRNVVFLCVGSNFLTEKTLIVSEDLVIKVIINGREVDFDASEALMDMDDLIDMIGVIDGLPIHDGISHGPWVEKRIRHYLQEELLSVNALKRRNLRLRRDRIKETDYMSNTPRPYLHPYAVPTAFKDRRYELEDPSDNPGVSDFLGSCIATNAANKSIEVTCRHKTTSTEQSKGSEIASDHRREEFPSSDGDNAGSKRPRLEVKRLGDVAVTRQDSPPRDPSLASQENSRDSWCGEEDDPVAGTMDGEETETMLSDRERIIKHRYECCRLCLQRSEELTDLFKGTRLGLVVREAVKDLLEFKVVRKHGSPWQVCYLCIQKLSDFQEFKDRCIETRDLWEECFEREEGRRSRKNYRKNVLENEENIDMMDVVINEYVSAVYDEEHNESDTISEGTHNSLQSRMSAEEITIKEEIITPDGDVSNGCDMVNLEIYEGAPTDTPTEIVVKQEEESEVEDATTEEDMLPHVNNEELDGGDSESHLTPTDTVWAKSEYITGTSRMWYKDKENVTTRPVKGANESTGQKSEEPLVLVLKKGGGVELCTVSELPSEVRIGIEKFRKKSGQVMKEGPLDKGD